MSLHGSQMKKANEETWISKFHFFGMVPDTFFVQFLQEEKSGKGVSEKKKSKVAKRKRKTANSK